jgi:hypothetical protein
MSCTYLNPYITSYTDRLRQIIHECLTAAGVLQFTRAVTFMYAHTYQYIQYGTYK